MTKIKGTFGLSLTSIAVIAFGFAMLQQPQSVLLVVGFALLAEKDEWLNHQVLQALLLTIAYYIGATVTGWVFGGLAQLFRLVGIYGAASVMNTVNTVVGRLLYIALIVFALLAVLKVLRGQDAGLPFLSKMVGRDLATTQAPMPQKTYHGQDCTSCGATLQEDTQFCTQCGAKNQ